MSNLKTSLVEEDRYITLIEQIKMKAIDLMCEIDDALKFMDRVKEEKIKKRRIRCQKNRSKRQY